MTPILTISKAEAMNPSRRNTMEDVHVSHAPGEWGCNDKEMAFVGVYDGHGGENMIWNLLFINV
jgi:protein phosphatase/protein phosphatase PTC1